ncbi:Uncharacterised protein [uncultured archaeon]|nr:Uncharacterised protein [uncultured archaeon]
MSQSLPHSVIIYVHLYYLSIAIDMIEEMRSSSEMDRSCRVKVENKKPKNGIGFDKIIKFLNAQKAVMDYAGLN